MNEENERWARFIWNNALQKDIRTLGWGFGYNSVITIDRGTEFRIGAIILATVRIQHQGWSNKFQISIIPDNSQDNPIIVDDVLLQDMVSVIDESIQHYIQYENRYYEDLALAS